MANFFWTLRCWLYINFRACHQYIGLGGMTHREVWLYAGSLCELFKPDGYSPRDAFLEDVTYWTE